MSLKDANNIPMHHSFYNQSTERKIPGLVVLGVLVMFVGALVMIFKKDTAPVVTQQDPSIIERVDMTNTRDSSVTVFWRTKQPTEGYIKYTFVSKDGSSQDKVAYDERDTVSQLIRRHNHVVTISYPRTDMDIPFYLVVNGITFGQSAQVPFMARTAQALQNPLDIEPLYGNVGRLNGKDEKEAVVIVTIGKTKPLLTQTNNDGTFLFSPCCLYSAQTGEPSYPSVDDPVRIEIIAEDGTSKILLSDLSHMSPLQETVIVDAKEDLQPLLADTTEIVPESVPEVLAASDSIIKLEPVDIIFPRDQAAIPGTRPLVRGVGEPGETIKGRFVPENRLFQTIVDESRNWLYQPTFDFPPGEHTLSIDTRNAFGQPVLLSRAFTILKSGEAVLGDATGSATLTPTEMPTPQVTQATSSPTLITAIPTPPVTGFSVLPFSIISIVLIVIGASFILLF